MRTTRRTLLQGGAAAAVGVSGASDRAARAQKSGEPLLPTDVSTGLPLLNTLPTTRSGDMLYRELGSTGEKVSLIGMGGFHIGKKELTDEESVRLIRTAIDRGITFLDNCWDYNLGLSETRMGKALGDGYRKKVFVMTKIDGRTKAEAARQIEQSLARLQTDHVDLLQFHEVIRMEDPDRIFAPGGAMEAFRDAKQAGKTRHIGFTGHKDPLVHRRMLETADQHGFHFDTVQMPVNVLDAHFRSFTHHVLPLALERKIGVLAMKTFGDHFILDHVVGKGLSHPVEMLHYSMTLPVSVVITGIDRPEILEQALEATKTFKPLSRTEVAALLSRTRDAALTGRYERFKTSPHFDGTAQNPKWLG